MKSKGIKKARFASLLIWAVICLAAFCMIPTRAVAQEQASKDINGTAITFAMNEANGSLGHEDTPFDIEQDKIRYRITGDVYFGDKYKFSKPCTLCRKDVFEKIPEYQTIKREKLNKHSARYHLLIEKVNRVFRSKIKEALEDLDYDLVVEKKGIKARGVKIPDITKEVIAKITG